MYVPVPFSDFSWKYAIGLNKDYFWGSSFFRKDVRFEPKI